MVQRDLVEQNSPPHANWRSQDYAKLSAAAYRVSLNEGWSVYKLLPVISAFGVSKRMAWHTGSVPFPRYCLWYCE